MDKKMTKYEQAKSNVITGIEIDCDGKSFYEKSLKEIKESAICREMQVIDFFNAIEKRIKSLKGKPELSLLKLGYEEALKVFVNGK